MSPLWPQPTVEQIRNALRRYAPRLAEQPIELVGEGWSLWAFRAGDHVLRFPKQEWAAAQLDQDRRLLPELARHVSIRLPVPDVYGEEGPNGAPFAGHPMLPGVSLITAAVLPAAKRGGSSRLQIGPSFGHDLGLFLRQLHSFPMKRALELGLTLRDGPAQRQSRIDLFESIARQIFPLISCEARTYTETRFSAYVNDPANFAFEPCLIHHDIDRQNTLIDPQTGELTGVIDFGDAVVSNPAADLWLPLIDFEALGIAGQVPAFLAAYGDKGLDLERAQIEAGFIQFLWPFHDIEYGLRIGDQDFVAGGIRALNESLPEDLECP